MTQNLALLRASAELSLAESPMEHIGSDNRYSISTQNQIRSRLGGWNYSAADRASIETRFWAKVKKSDACWLWTGSITGRPNLRYGQIRLPGRARTQPTTHAHRLSWELAYGPIPSLLQINHHCDVPHCVRPEHLYLGTQQDNLRDARSRGRLDNSLPRTRALTPAERLAIYHMPNRRGVVVAMAMHYGVSKTCITLIRKGRFAGCPNRVAS